MKLNKLNVFIICFNFVRKFFELKKNNHDIYSLMIFWKISIFIQTSVKNHRRKNNLFFTLILISYEFEFSHFRICERQRSLIIQLYEKYKLYWFLIDEYIK